MNSQRTTDEFLDFLKERGIEEGYVLVSEIKMFIGFKDFCPHVGVKIWKTKVDPCRPYSYEISHYAHTPIQGGPYYPSNQSDETAIGALESAIRNFRSFIDKAIEAGESPNNTWLVPNEFY